jgi:hypothetical protein
VVVVAKSILDGSASLPSLEELLHEAEKRLLDAEAKEREAAGLKSLFRHTCVSSLKCCYVFSISGSTSSSTTTMLVATRFMLDYAL